MKDAILHAHERIRPHIRRTECIHSQSLSDASGAEVFLKLENRQLSGSFKLRGVANKLLSLSPEEERERQLVAASTGNHGAAFAHAVSEFGLDGMLFLPTNAARNQARRPSRPRVFPSSWWVTIASKPKATRARYAAENGCVWVSPYNDPLVVAGQGTVAVELLDQVEAIDACSRSGGRRRADFGDRRLPQGGRARSRRSSAASRRPRPSCTSPSGPARSSTMESRPTLSDATAGGIEPGSITFDLCRQHVDDYELLDEDEIAAGHPVRPRERGHGHRGRCGAAGGGGSPANR